MPSRSSSRAVASPGFAARFNARFAHGHLIRIQDEITERMSSGSVINVNSCGVDEERNVVHVGVDDPASDESRALVAAYGDAVDVCHEEPIELLSL